MTVDEVAQARDAFSQTVYDDYYRGVPMLRECGIEERRKVIEDYCDTELNAFSDKLVTWPFYSVKEKHPVYLWNRFVSSLHGSNGMCAGNTPEEALVQGFSEIFERYASTRIIQDEIVPPDIPPAEYNGYTEIQQIVEQIENSGPFRVIVKDCSLGQGLPVCAAILVDCQKQRYCASFGSHPHIPIAIERCLTELLQGYDPAEEEDNRSKLQWFDAAYHLTDPYLNVCNMHINGTGTFPPEFFTGTPSYEHRPFQNMAQADNRQMFHYCVDLAQRLSSDVFIRDVSYLGFPAYFIVVPGVSHYTMTRRLVRRETVYEALCDVGRYKGELDDKLLKKLLIALNRWDGIMVKPKLSYSCPQLKTAVLLTLNEFERASQYLELRLKQPFMDQKEEMEMKALQCSIKLQLKGHDREMIGRTVSLFFSPEIWEDLQRQWLCDNPASVILNRIPYPEILTEEERASNELFLQLRKRFKENPVRQENLSELFRS